MLRQASLYLIFVIPNRIRKQKQKNYKKHVKNDNVYIFRADFGIVGTSTGSRITPEKIL